MATVITAGNATNGLSLSADNAGTFQFKTGTGAGTTALSIDASQVTTFAAGVSGTTGSFSGNMSFNSGYGSAAVAYGCRAWVNFNGTGTVAIRASGNVTSITDNGTGDYTVNFTTAMPDANYSVTCSAARSDNAEPLIFGISSSAPTTTAVRVEANDNQGSLFDTLYGCVAILR
jgi:hypothetical protein